MTRVGINKKGVAEKRIFSILHLERRGVKTE